MEYINEASKYLRIYLDLKVAKENLESEIDKTKSELIIFRKDGNLYNNDFIFNKVFTIKSMENNLESTKKVMMEISYALNNLSSYEKNILILYYINDLRSNVIYKKLNCSERKFYEDKARVIRKFAINLFHIRVAV